MASINSGRSGDVMWVSNYAILFTSIIKWRKGNSWTPTILHLAIWAFADLREHEGWPTVVSPLSLRQAVVMLLKKYIL